MHCLSMTVPCLARNMTSFTMFYLLTKVHRNPDQRSGSNKITTLDTTHEVYQDDYGYPASHVTVIHVVACFHEVYISRIHLAEILTRPKVSVELEQFLLCAVFVNQSIETPRQQLVCTNAFNLLRKHLKSNEFMRKCITQRLLGGQCWCCFQASSGASLQISQVRASAAGAVM